MRLDDEDRSVQPEHNSVNPSHLFSQNDGYTSNAEDGLPRTSSFEEPSIGYNPQHQFYSHDFTPNYRDER